MNLPNRLTVIRIFLVPFFIAFMLIEPSSAFAWNRLAALLVFVIASVTDFADGKIARKYGLITDFGKFLDPLADKILVLSALISLCFLADNDIFGKLLLISTVIVIFRELAVTSMRLVTAGCGVVVPANIYGKVKTVSHVLYHSFACHAALHACGRLRRRNSPAHSPICADGNDEHNDRYFRRCLYEKLLEIHKSRKISFAY